MSEGITSRHVVALIEDGKAATEALHECRETRARIAAERVELELALTMERTRAREMALTLAALAMQAGGELRVSAVSCMLVDKRTLMTVEVDAATGDRIIRVGPHFDAGEETL